MAVPFYIPTSRAQSVFLYVLTYACYLLVCGGSFWVLFFTIVALMGVKWNLIVLLICISLMIS